ncbi:recombination regulator RecX [Salipaludibacillus sp. CUR1]|uniref:recombination regulator RecX n=1 Tax=Salipaludibacillus sp. CUR1 TaxID=2820003 RepID=UPI001E391ED3|nr:recombination regulator RecX [Salipaludibacillus sp. CUR1]MCE7792246.1 recombination regulator RecX [Salipaludibacillus sp. CUR1]
MPIISKITAAKKKKGRFHIYLKTEEGEEYAFSVSEDLLVNEHLLKGKELTEEDIERLKEKDDVDKAMQKALNYLSYRMRSEGEITRYLRDQEVSEGDIADIIDRLRELQFIDDLRFAEAFVRTKRDTAKKGPLLIEQELYQKGVSQHHIDRAMKEYAEETQLDHAIKMVEKKQSSYKKEGTKKKQQKLMQFVIQRGYPQSVASKAVAEAELETDPEAEWEGLVKHGEKAWNKFSGKEDWERIQRVKQQLYTRGFTSEKIEEWLTYKKEKEEE